MSRLLASVVTPIVASYLLYHWKSMRIDKSVPPARRDTVRALAGEIDDAIRGFLRGQSTLSLVLALFYAISLSLIGLRHGALIGFAAGSLSFIPYVGSLTGLVVLTFCRNSAILAELDINLAGTGRILHRAIPGGLCAGSVPSCPACASQSSVGDIRPLRLRLSFRLRRPADRGTCCSCCGCPHAVRNNTMRAHSTHRRHPPRSRKIPTKDRMRSPDAFSLNSG
jgi:hypothetical protein